MTKGDRWQGQRCCSLLMGSDSVTSRCQRSSATKPWTAWVARTAGQTESVLDEGLRGQPTLSGVVLGHQISLDKAKQRNCDLCTVAVRGYDGGRPKQMVWTKELMTTEICTFLGSGDVHRTPR